MNNLRSQFDEMPDYVKNGPMTMWEDVPTGGLVDPKWEEFEKRYSNYILACINEKSPECGMAAHDIIERFRNFFTNVLTHYEYRPEEERFRCFIRRFIHATIEHVLGHAGNVKGYSEDFSRVQKSCDDDLEWGFKSVCDAMAVDITIESNRLSDDQRYIFKALIVDKFPREELVRRYGEEKVAEYFKLALSLCETIRKDIHIKAGPDFFKAA